MLSAQTVEVNLPDLHDTAVKLSGPVLAGIYSGQIHDWDDPAIAALNAGVTLPHKSIVPIRRQDASGDTFVFTQFLSFSTPSWENKTNYGTAIDWPSVPAMQTATSNDGMVKQLAATPYAVGYLGGSFQTDAAKAGLQVASLQNADGQFVLPTAETVTNAKQPNAAIAAALRDLLVWCVNPASGSASNVLSPLLFISLPTSIRALSESQIATIH